MHKKLHLFIVFVFFLTYQLNAQGLESIIVETYYISDENDTSVDGDGGTLPVGSTTYRVYADMLPGYIFQTTYGVPVPNKHELIIKTSTKFFNNEDRGDIFPNFGRNRLDDNTVMLDTWLSAGRACSECIGILKSADDGIETIENGDDVLQNADSAAGIPLTEQDGIIAGEPVTVTSIGFNNVPSDQLEVFDNSNDFQEPVEFISDNGAWGSLEGTMGPDSLENRVLIGQFTTDGRFQFELNIQIRDETTSEVERYVARDPINDEIFIPSLIFDSEDVTSTNELLDESTDLMLYPNPTITSISVNPELEINGKGSYTIFSYQGQELMSEEFSIGNYQEILYDIDVSQLPNGIFFFELNQNGTAQVSQFVKMSN